MSRRHSFLKLFKILLMLSKCDKFCFICLKKKLDVPPVPPRPLCKGPREGKCEIIKCLKHI